MKRLVSLVILFILAFNLHAQDLTGIWRGYFLSGQGFLRQRYKYEIQIDQQNNNALSGVTYSYKTTVFYGKATLRGIYMASANNVLIQEVKLVEVKISDKSEPCIMTCYLDYGKDGELETLQGTFTSVNDQTKGDCGAGTVYLEKVPESDFQKEDFLVKKEQEKLKQKQKPKKESTTRTTKPKETQPLVDAKPKSPAKTTTGTKKKPSTGSTLSANKTKPNPKDRITTTKPHKDSSSIVQVPLQKPEEPVEPLKIKPKLPVPDIIKERENKLVKTLITNSSDIQIQLYDNGEIDDDTITVYHNNELVANKKRLSNQPITFNIKASVNDPIHEFVMVADNLGRIPPNTALMVITTGGKRYELFITSTEQKNAKVIIEFKVQGSDT